MKGMRVKKKLLHKKKHTKGGDNRTGSLRGFGFVSLCTVFAVILTFSDKGLENGNNKQVYAASEEEKEQTASLEEEKDEDYLPTGIAGVVAGVSETPMPGTTVNRIGSSCEQVMVGQRVLTVDSAVAELYISASMESTVNDLDSKAMTLAANPKIMSDEDYDTLLRIVEAEAGGEDLKGRILVANVIMNRVKSEEFPDTVSEVVWEYDNGVPQFSPTYDGRINEVTVSEKTKEAVKQALEGVDYSQGALFFIQKSAAEEHNVTWFEKDLKWLFKYGVHEFYTYPEEGEKTDTKEEEAPADLVSMETAEAS